MFDTESEPVSEHGAEHLYALEARIEEHNAGAHAGLMDDFATVRKAALQPRPKLTLPQWADKHRRLASSVGAVGGPWRTSRVEVARGPMMAVTEPGVRAISVQCATQLMKTSLLENIIGYHIHLDPCPILLTQPKEPAAKTFSKERFKPMVRATPVLRERMGESRERGGNDTQIYQEFPGGFLAMEGAGSPTNLAMRAIRITLLDEIDKYQSTKEGDPVLLAEERTSTFVNNSLHVRVCSPTWDETSRIGKSFKDGDQRAPFIACPHCGYEQVLDFFRHVHWAKGDDGEHFPYTAAIKCESCNVEWEESERLRLCSTEGAIRWKQTKPFVCCEVKQEPLKTRSWEWSEEYQVGYACCTECGGRAVPNTHASFKAGKLYSPFLTMPELAKKWLDSKDDPETKQTFVNTQLGETFSVQALKKIEAHVLASHREDYPADVPNGIAVLTAGVDVQPGSKVSEGRLECEVVGWGRGEESWSIAYEVFLGDPAKPEIWAELDAFLKSTFEHESGARMAIKAACIDSGGHNVQEVYAYARNRLSRNIWAIKGASDRSGSWSPVWPAPKFDPKRSKQTGFKPIIIGVNAAKESIRQKLLVAEPGPGYCHFPEDYPDARFDQLTAEQLQLEKKNGFAVRRWHLPNGRANEALDVRVYAYAALQGLIATRKFNLEKALEAIELALHRGATRAPDSAGLGPDVPPPQRMARPRKRPSSWMAS